jgi:thiamine transport system permease protein
LTTNFELFGTTAFIALMSAVVSMALGFPISNWLGSLQRTPRRILSAVLTLPFVLPAFLIGLTLLPIQNQLDLDSRFGIYWILSAHVLMNAGFAARVILSNRLPLDQAQAAALDGASEKQISRYIALPQLLPALSAGSVLIALYSATSFGLIRMLGQGKVRTLETEIYVSALQQLDLGKAGLIALLQTLLTLALVFISRPRSQAAHPLFGALEYQRKPARVGAKIIGLLFTLLVAGVLAGVFYRALFTGAGLENFANLAGRGNRDILNLSVLEATANSIRNLVVTLAIALPLTWWLARFRRLSPLVLLPLGVSPVVFGLIFLVLSGYLPVAISSSWLLVPIIQVLFVVPLCFQILQPARAGMDQEILDAASVDGANKARRFWAIELPVLQRPASIAVAFGSLISLGEFGAASFLAYGSNETLPLVMFRLAARPGAENLGMAMAAASLFILLAAYVVWLVSAEPDN